MEGARWPRSAKPVLELERMSAEDIVSVAAPSLAPEQASDAASAINQRLFETSLDLIFVVDGQGTFIRVSPSSAVVLGYAPEELIGRSAIGFVFEEDLDATRQEMRLARRGRETRNFDCRYAHKNGSVVPLAWTGVWSEPEQQHIFIGRDMTERMKLEAQLRHAQKMEAIGQLTGGVAHDFNNILTVITGSADVLLSALEHDPKLHGIAKSIDEAAERGAQLTQRMLAFARKQALQSRTLDLNEIVQRMGTMLQRTLGEDIAVNISTPRGLWPAVADPSQLEDAILNLAVNARDAMPNGGRIVIETANVHLDDAYAAENVEVAPGDYAALVITDSGTGMPKEVIERAFDPFFTTKDVGKGTGLGLSMVYGFVKQSRGHVKIYSEVGHGTSIRIYLPRSMTESDVAADALQRPEQKSSGGESILVVEDDAAVRRVAVAILENLGYRVLQAGDGKSALEILGRADGIDLLFTDLIMPNGMNGMELLEKARALRPNVRALFTSGYSEEFLRGRSGDDGVPMVGKPYRRHRLAEAVRDALGKPV
jgi:PAS domain S-box-containing protein